MNRLTAISLFATILTATGLRSAEPAADVTRVPVLLELFTSEGCSSCPPADRLLAALDETQPVPKASVIVLSEHVDYWNSLGWKDPFSAAAFSARQEQYASRLGNSGVYTPQLIVDGGAELVGGNKKKALLEIEKASQQSKTSLTLSEPKVQGSTVHVHIASADLSTAGGDAELFVALAQSRAQVQVEHGENAGSLLAHTGVVRVLTSLGKAKAGSSIEKDASLAIPPGIAPENLRVVAFLQNAKTHRVVGATQIILREQTAAMQR